MVKKDEEEAYFEMTVVNLQTHTQTVDDALPIVDFLTLVGLHFSGSTICGLEAAVELNLEPRDMVVWDVRRL